MLYFNIGRHGCSKPREDCVKLSVDAGFRIWYRCNNITRINLILSRLRSTCVQKHAKEDDEEDEEELAPRRCPLARFKNIWRSFIVATVYRHKFDSEIRRWIKQNKNSANIDWTKGWTSKLLVRIYVAPEQN
jgi:hypothetical protein